MATKANIVIDQGTTFKAYLTLTDDDDVAIDLSGYTIESKFKQHYTSSNSYSFTCEIEEASNGIFSLSMSANATSNVPSGRYVYDIETTDTVGNKLRVLEGEITITPEVTK